MNNIQNKNPRMMRLTDETHELFRNICLEEEMTSEGLLKRLLANWILKKTKEEQNEQHNS